jgi:hypothetical protein
MVRKGEYASIGLPLAVVDDLSRAKLVLYLSPEEVAAVESGKARIFVGGKVSDAGFSKIWKETDEKYISSYRAELPVVAGKYPFSSLVKVEIR